MGEEDGMSADDDDERVVEVATGCDERDQTTRQVHRRLSTESNITLTADDDSTLARFIGTSTKAI